ncbi:DUF2493 domain-containing protein [Crossiella sp. SN42]|uniref:SLOG family protein n=1 Tax=Crossiella sp. SN42 TaxID=2944808 RepID=UPI00207CE923|nr:SLOG family protein [Crossiella sp. SN42]MCO1581204.1 DUF2493 domain-containing protein [Crossiella sp. SN42]
MTPRILITGSRNWTNVPIITEHLARARRQFPGAVLVHGDCRGADRIAAHLWCSWGLAPKPTPPPGTATAGPQDRSATAT